jgi:hypothetical protein
MFLADALSRQFEDESSIIIRNLEITAMDTNDSVAFQANKRRKSIPTKLKQADILVHTHAKGHFSVEMMFRDIWTQGYWWPNIRKDLRDHVQSCLPCLRFNIHKEGFHPLQSIEADAP